MKKILLISDSHGLQQEILDIKKRHQVDRIIHCGDSELDFDANELTGMDKVAGNCDTDARFPNETVITIGELTFFVTHGHLYNVKSNLLPLSYRAEELKANVICFGHTHIAGAEKMDKLLFINPGSIRMPRNRIEKTYAILEWETTKNIRVRFYTVDGELVSKMSYETTLED
ncbi:metallophosphoesterase [Oceanobacillus senegalensis]|uniref:metallophosphoesterase n=1 Tax=Oceanobacillus senegalensis TaxID=1936063 RepID=UPI000A313A2F|nr:metallophosphoesterase [Oceanobacillus senegalensis]